MRDNERFQGGCSHLSHKKAQTGKAFPRNSKSFFENRLDIRRYYVTNITMHGCDAGWLDVFLADYSQFLANQRQFSTKWSNKTICKLSIHIAPWVHWGFLLVVLELAGTLVFSREGPSMGVGNPIQTTPSINKERYLKQYKVTSL